MSTVAINSLSQTQFFSVTGLYHSHVHRRKVAIEFSCNSASFISNSGAGSEAKGNSHGCLCSSRVYVCFLFATRVCLLCDCMCVCFTACVCTHKSVCMTASLFQCNHPLIHSKWRSESQWREGAERRRGVERGFRICLRYYGDKVTST